MNTSLVSYTLASPGQDYDAIHDLLRMCSYRIAHADAGLWYLMTNTSEATLESLLNAAKDWNDTFVIWGPNVRPYNRTVKWEPGAQATPSGAIMAATYLRTLLAKSRQA